MRACVCVCVCVCVYVCVEFRLRWTHFKCTKYVRGKKLFHSVAPHQRIKIRENSITGKVLKRFLFLRHIAPFLCIYQPLRSGRKKQKFHFLNGVLRVCIQNFPSPSLVSKSRLKNPVSLIIMPLLEKE